MKCMNSIKILTALSSVCVSLKPYNFWKQITQQKTWDAFPSPPPKTALKMYLHVCHTQKFSSYLTHNTAHTHYK
jgi:hypothetical protein